MTTSQDKLQNQIQKDGNYATYRGVFENGFGDPRGVNPKPEYQEQSSLSKAARGDEKHQLDGYSGIPGVDIAPDETPAEYPFCQTQESLSGHVIEMDDTKGSERLLIKHASGAGVEMRSDGTVILTTMRNQITVVNGSQTVKVEGDARMMYDNLTVEVAGDYNLNVSGNMYQNVSGDLFSSADHTSEVNTGNKSVKVHGNLSDTIIGNHASMKMGEVDDVVKGERTVATGGKLTLASTGELKLSSEARIVGAATSAMHFGSPKINMTAATGTIGGEGVTMYAQNFFGTSATFTEGVTAPTFHGDLNGTATTSTVTQSQTYGEQSTGSAGSITNTATNTTETFQPTASGIETYVTSGIFGVNDIKIDLGDHMKNAIDQTVNTNGKSNSKQSTTQIRSSLKDEANKNDETYTANAVAEGKLNPEYTKTAPGGVNRTVSTQPTATRIYSTVQ